MKRLITGVAACAIIVGVAAATTAYGGSDTKSDEVPFTADSAGFHADYSGVNLGAFQRDGEQATEVERDTILRVLMSERPREGNVGPTKSELESLDKSRVLLDDPETGRRIVAIPSTRGDTCKVATKYRQAFVSGCTQQFDETGVAVSYAFASPNRNIPDEFFALVADDVTSIRLTLDSGQAIAVPFDNNALWWSAEGDERPVSLTVTRGGEEFTTEQPFVRPL